MKGLRKIELCLKRIHADLALIEEELASLEAIPQEGKAVNMRSFVQQVFHPTAKPKLAEKPDGMINAYYAYCKQHGAEVTLPAPKIKVSILTALREEYSSTQVTYNVEYLTRRLLVNPYFMAKERGISLEETLASTDFDWHAASVPVPWWQVLDSPRVTIQGQVYAAMT